MSYKRITDLPDVLRAAGIEVVLHDGWRTRGLSTSKPFEPEYLIWHHDASPAGDSPGVPASMIRNYAKAGAQIWVDRRGRWHFIASGRAAHAGTVLPGMPDNYDSVGIETDHTTGEAWPPALLASLRKGTAAILAHWRVSAARGLHFHKSVCSPRGRKVDPDGLDLAAERDRVHALMVTATPPPASLPTVSLKRAKKAAKRAGWSKKFAGKKLRAERNIIRRALANEGCATYVDWQRKLGRKGDAVNGIPGATTLAKLGVRQGFRVIP